MKWDDIFVYIYWVSILFIVSTIYSTTDLKFKRLKVVVFCYHLAQKPNSHSQDQGLELKAFTSFVDYCCPIPFFYFFYYQYPILVNLPSLLLLLLEHWKLKVFTDDAGEKQNKIKQKTKNLFHNVSDVLCVYHMTIKYPPPHHIQVERLILYKWYKIICVLSYSTEICK